MRKWMNDWNKLNPILADGEIGHIIGLLDTKTGDGKTPWRDLPFTGSVPVNSDPFPFQPIDHRWAAGLTVKAGQIIEHDGDLYLTDIDHTLPASFTTTNLTLIGGGTVSSGLGLAAIRGAVGGFGTGGNITLALPAGSTAGDVAVVYTFDRTTEAIPGLVSGGVSLQSDSGQGGARTQYTVLTSTDITAGSVAVPTPGGANCAVMVVCVGGTTAIGTGHSRGTGVANTPVSVARALANDVIVWVTMTRQDTTTPPLTISARGLEVLNLSNADFHLGAYIDTPGTEGGVLNAGSTSSAKNVVLLSGAIVR